MLIRLLLAIHDPALKRRAGRLAAQPNVLLYATSDLEGMWEALAQDSADLVLIARELIPDPPTEFVRALGKLPDHPELIVFQNREEARDRMALLAAGCFAVLTAELPDETLTEALKTLVRRRREGLITRFKAEGPGEGFHLSDFASASPSMEAVLHLARRVAASDSSLLILGETGVGKEWLARAIHAEGPRSGGPFIAVNMAAVPETLLESELFGHEKGAFTGAVGARRGYFELAHRGTIFLDEIGDMPLHLQSRLLRVLQERKIQRLGGEHLIEVDVRVMAATHQDLAEAIEAKVFRSDLYYRLGVVTLTLPPLRERQEDIPALVDSYVERFRLQLGRPVNGVSESALEALVAYAWPGNVRELINVMERAVLLAEGSEVNLAELPHNIAQRRGEGRGGRPEPGDSLPLPADWLERTWPEVRQEMTEVLEKAYLTGQLQATRGRVGETAARVGIDPRSLYQKMQRLGLRKESFKPPVPKRPTTRRPTTRRPATRRPTTPGHE